MSDALSEATFLLLTATALLCAVHALRSGSPLHFGLCGLFAGLTYLTRPEGVLLVASTGLVGIVLQFIPARRYPWRRVLACGASLTLTAVVASLPYVAATHQFTTKPTGRELLKTAAADQESQEQRLPLHTAVASARRPLATSLWAVWAQEHEKGSLAFCLRALLMELNKGFYYVAWLPALVALWWFRQRLRLVPGAWVLLVLSLLHGLVLLRLAMVMGYVSERHVLVLVLCGIFWAAAGLCAFGSWWATLVRTRPTFGMVLPLAMACAGLPQSLKPLHANRAGHHAAGLWLAAHTQPVDPITDPFCWAHYYAGRVFWEGLTPPVPEGHRVTGYVVVERPDREHSRLPLIPRAHQLAEQGQLVYYWPEERPVEKADVFVDAVPP
jgi:hypothetical protein